MIKLLWRIALLIILGLAFAWLADRPEKITVQWMGREYTMTLLIAAAALLIALTLFWIIWRFVSRLWQSPRTAREYWRFRKHKKAYESLSRGLIAASAGDTQAASRHATTAAKTLNNEPLVNVLAAQAAQLRGDRGAVKTAFEDMAKDPETQVLGLRGLFMDAKQSGDLAAAIGHAEKALAINPRLAWASTAMLQIQSARKDWTSAAATIATQGKAGLLPRPEADRKRAALLAAEALQLEDTNRDRALSLASDAHSLDPALVPAALVAARCHIANTSTRKAVRILRDAWSKSPHPEIAAVLANAKPGDDPENCFERVRDLVGDTETNLEGAVSLARAAVIAKRWDVARKSLEPHLLSTPQARICALMANIEDAAGDKGRSREWLARALNAPRDPMWVSDGVASPRWTPISPVTGEIVPCEWKVPYETQLLPEFVSVETTDAPTQLPSPGSALTFDQPKPALLPRLPDDPGIPDEAS
jgi:HemY protein